MKNVKRLMLEVIRCGHSASGVFWTDSDPSRTAFENRIITETEGLTEISVEIGDAVKKYVSSGDVSGLPVVNGLQVDI